MTAVNFTKPVTSDLRADVLLYIRNYMDGQAKLFDGDTLTSPPTNTIRYSSSNSRFEKWNGSAWAALPTGDLPLSGGTLTGGLTGTTANFTAGLSMNGNAVWHAGNLTPSNYLPLAGGTMAGVLNSVNILPTVNNVSNLGSDTFRYAGVYATNFYEAGTALSSKYSASGHSHSYLPLSGGTLSGGLTGTTGAFSTSLTVGGVAVSLSTHTHSTYLALGGGTLTGLLTTAAAGIDIANADTTLTRIAAGIVGIEGTALGYLDIPIAAALERGKIYPISAGITVNTGTAAYAYGVYNDSAVAITLTQGAGLTLRKAGTATSGNLTLAPYGLAAIWYRSSTEAVVNGNLS